MGELESSRWFTRGWTLQELLAPYLVKFFSNKWDYLGTRLDLSRQISNVTGIDEAYLTLERDVSVASVAQRMSWAANRQTTLPEDIAYSLLGIFKVNMPLFYGEGENAFMRLQQEIIGIDEDQSFFAWDISATKEWHWGRKNLNGALAPSPDWFKSSADIVKCELGDTWDPPTVTSRGLYMQAPIVRFGDGKDSKESVLLKCRRRNDLFNFLAIPIEPGPDQPWRTTHIIHRNVERLLGKVEAEKCKKLVEQSKAEKIYIVPVTNVYHSNSVTRRYGNALRDLPLGLVVEKAHPQKCWMKEEGFLHGK